VEQMAARGASVLRPVFDAHGGRKGRQAVQTNPANYRDAERMVEQAVRLANAAPNIQVKFPATAAGIAGSRRRRASASARWPRSRSRSRQALAAAEAAERGLDPTPVAGDHVEGIRPIVVLMIGPLGRLDEGAGRARWAHGQPRSPDWAGIAVFKRTYALFRDRGYRSGSWPPPTRHPLHWTQLIGADAR